MKKQTCLLLLMIFLLFSLSGCQDKYSADQYVGEQITAMKTGDSAIFSALLDKGTEKENKQHTLQFPEELKTPYLAFLKKAFNTVEFEVAEAEKNGDNTFSVQVSFTPLNIEDTTKDIRNAYLEHMSSPDLTSEVAALLTASEEALAEKPIYENKVSASIDVTKTDNSFSMEPEALEILMSQVLQEYMVPYASVCEVLDVHGFLCAYLDAAYKGDMSQIALYTGETPEELQSWYNEDALTPPDDMSALYTDRYIQALQGVFRQCRYTVGIPRKAEGVGSYTADVTVVPNNSLIQVFSELENGTYYSEEEVDRKLVELLEAYAASPAYGEETVVTVPLNMSSLLNLEEDDDSFTELSNAILPVE